MFDWLVVIGAFTIVVYYALNAIARIGKRSRDNPIAVQSAQQIVGNAQLYLHNDIDLETFVSMTADIFHLLKNSTRRSVVANVEYELRQFHSNTQVNAILPIIRQLSHNTDYADYAL